MTTTSSIQRAQSRELNPESSIQRAQSSRSTPWEDCLDILRHTPRYPVIHRSVLTSRPLLPHPGLHRPDVPDPLGVPATLVHPSSRSPGQVLRPPRLLLLAQQGLGFRIKG